MRYKSKAVDLVWLKRTCKVKLRGLKLGSKHLFRVHCGCVAVGGSGEEIQVSA